jgi:two-component system, sensor histidine kinase and response regulator
MSSILVIDDDEIVCDNIAMILEHDGFFIHHAHNGWDGIQAALANPPDLIICDIVMPQLDGYGVLEKLRDNPLTATIPFIFLTGQTEKGQVRRGMDEGADDYLTKPIALQEITKAVHARLARVETWKKKLRSGLDELRRNMAVILPHELRTPLTGIIGAASLLKNDNASLSETDRKTMAEMILMSGEQLSRRIQKYLIYHELEEHLKDPRSLEAYKKNRLALSGTASPGLRDVVTEAASSIARRARRDGDLILELDDILVPLASEDLKEIVEELVDNAFKFSQPGTPVLIRGGLSAEDYTLSVIDRGRGISPDKIALMGAFVQFDRKRHEQQGLGLGIAVVKRLLEVYGGRLLIESVPMEHTKVTAVIPL